MEIQAPESAKAAAEKSVRDEFGSVWVDDTYFQTNNRYWTLGPRPVSTRFYAGLLSLFSGYEEEAGCKSFVVENGDVVSHVLLDASGHVWQVTSIQNAPAEWKPQR